MKKLVTILLAAATMLSFQSCKKITGDGPTVTETRAITGFRSIRTEIDGDLHFTQSPTYSVEVRAQRNILDLIRTSTVNGALVIALEGNHNLGNHDHIDIYVSGPTAEGFNSTGSGNVEVTGNLNTSNLALQVNGSGSINIPNLTAPVLNAIISGSGDINISNGTGNEEDLTIAGSGSIDMLGFQVHRATTQTAGSGTTKINVTSSLEATIAGSGNVYYKGRPAITTTIIGSGRVQPW